MIKKIFKSSIKQIATLVAAFLIAFLLFLAVSVVKGQWDEPDEAPPGGNVSAPLNVGSVFQTKLAAPGQGLPTNPSGSIGANDFYVGSMGQWVSQLVGGACIPIEFDIPQQNPLGQPVIPAYTSIYTPVNFWNNSATNINGQPFYVTPVPVPQTCINSSCDIFATEFVDTNADGNANPCSSTVTTNCDDTIGVRSTSIMQLEFASGGGVPEVNWHRWVKNGGVDGVDCESGINGSIPVGCDKIIKLPAGEKNIFLYDDAIIASAGTSPGPGGEQTYLDWTLVDHHALRYASFHICE